MSESIAVSCPLLSPQNPAWVEDWGGWSPAYRRQVLDALASRGMIGAAGADPNSLYPPTILYPIGHPCRGNETVAGDGSAAPWENRDEGERARAAAAAMVNTFDGGGATGLPGFGVKLPDWLKWLAIAMIVAGVVMLVKKRGR